MTIPDLYALYLQHPSVRTDTRKLQPGDLFFALKGPNFNANQLAHLALGSGAAYAIVDELPEGGPHPSILVVEDVLHTLQELARYHRQQFNIPFLAITGSNGKTTTKELIHSVLSTTFKTYTTQGNLNNHIGIPLTLLSIRKDAQIAVVEMGANHRGEIAGYCRYALPTHGIITNVGKAHLEGFGGLEGVRLGKGELYDHLRAHDGTAFVFWDAEYLRQMSVGIPRVVRYGTSPGVDLMGDVAGHDTCLRASLFGRTVHTQLVGDYNLPNVLAAACVGQYFGVDQGKLCASLESYEPTNSRSQLIRSGSNTIILDAYNANPSSMAAAIENFARLDESRKVLMLGGMKELGPESAAEHRRLVSLLQRYKWTDVVLVGGDFEQAAGDYTYLPDTSAARAWLHNRGFKNTAILIKGSRGIAMENVLES